MRIILIFFHFLTAVILNQPACAAASLSCLHVIKDRHDLIDGEKIMFLMELGFYPEVATKMVAERPDLVEKILADPKASRPITLYRGLPVALKDFNPKFRGGNFLREDGDGVLFCAPNLSWPLLRIVKGKEVSSPSGIRLESTLVEFQVPVFVFNAQYNIIFLKDMPDMTPFITRIGVPKYGVGKQMFNTNSPDVPIEQMSDLFDWTSTP